MDELRESTPEIGEVTPQHTVTPKKLLLLLFIFVLFFLIGFVLATHYFANPASHKSPQTTRLLPTQPTYVNKQYGYKFIYPSDITILEAATPNKPTPTNINLFVPLEKGELQKAILRQGDMTGVCTITVLANPKRLTIAQWAPMYHLNAASGDNLVKITGDAKLDTLPAKTFSIFLFDHNDKAIAAARDNVVYLIRYPETVGNPNFDSDPQSKEMSADCKNLIPTFKIF
ncbi:MAG: hypothetical protein ACR2LN_08115 [Candidatus Levyibacteriota bacterium]